MVFYAKIYSVETFSLFLNFSKAKLGKGENFIKQRKFEGYSKLGGDVLLYRYFAFLSWKIPVFGKISFFFLI